MKTRRRLLPVFTLAIAATVLLSLPGTGAAAPVAAVAGAGPADSPAASDASQPQPRPLSLAEAEALAVAYDPQVALAALDAFEAALAVKELDEAPSGPRIVPPWEWASPYPWSLMKEQYARAAQDSQLRLASLQEAHAALAARQAAEQAYLEALSAEERLAAAEAGLEAADSQLASARAGQRAGVLSALDVAQAEQARQAAATSVSAAQRQADSAHMALCSRLGLNLDTPLSLTTRFTAATQPLADAAADTEQALRRRLELVTAREQTTLARLYFDNARKSFGEGSNLPTYGQAERDLQRAALRERQQRDNVVLQVRQAHLSLLTAWEQYGTDQAALAVSEQAFAASLVRLQAGLISQTQATEAQTALARARAGAAEALYRYNLALASYSQATGAALPEPEPGAD